MALSRTVIIGAFGLGFHGSQGGGVLEGEVADGRQMQLAGAEGTQARRVGGGR